MSNSLRVFAVIAVCVPAAPVHGEGAASAVAVRDRADLRQAVVKKINGDLAGWVAMYKEIHASPELSLSEEKSAARLAAIFKKAGYEVTANFGGYGVVGVMKNGPGPTVLIRTDMDALPVTEETGLPYASKVKIEKDDGSHVGVMHACGHDIHQTVLAGTAQELAALKDRWSGTVVLVAQPAEELGRGARMMLDAGLLSQFPKPDACIALHVAHDIPAGSVGYTPGWNNANVDSVDIRIYGKGGHGAYPHLCVDPIVAAAQLVVALQTIVSRQVDPIESAVVTVGSIHAGTKHNVIPDTADLQLTVRSYKDDVRKKVLDSIRQMATDICKAMGCPRPPDVKVHDEEFTPAAYNDPKLTAGAVEIFRAAFGADKVMERPPSMGGEDFGQFAKEAGVPGFMFGLGTIDQSAIDRSKQPGGPPLASLHSSKFAPIPEPTIRTGVEAMTSLALALLGDGKS